MSASDVRRGPGWWMDPDGGWNPPEDWPEATPPLPGWVRTGNGRWQPPVDHHGALREPTADELAHGPTPDEVMVPEPAGPTPPPDETDTGRQPRPPLGLRYAPPSADVPERRWQPKARTVILAALAAALSAGLVAAGLVGLLSLF